MNESIGLAYFKIHFINKHLFSQFRCSCMQKNYQPRADLLTKGFLQPGYNIIKKAIALFQTICEIFCIFAFINVQESLCENNLVLIYKPMNNVIYEENIHDKKLDFGINHCLNTL